MGIREAWASLLGNNKKQDQETSWTWNGGTKSGHIFDGTKFKGSSLYPSSWNLDNSELREQSRVAYWDSTQARSIVKRLVENVVGTGLALESRPIWQLLKGITTLTEEEKHEKAREIEMRFDLWASSHEPDAAGKMTFYEIQDFEFLHRLIDGDTVMILRYSGDASRMSPLSIQFILPEQVTTPTEKIALEYAKTTGRRIIDGIEIDSYGKELAVHVQTENLQEWTKIPFTGPSGRVFVLHPVNTDTMGSVRGTPILAPLVHELKKITDYTVAEIEAAVINAVIAVWIKPSQNAPSTRALAGIGKNKASSESSSSTSTQPGQKTFDKPGLIVQTLGEGEEVESFDTKRPNANFGTFVRQIELSLSASQGMPVSIMNMEATKSYSAIRAELLMFWNKVEIERAKSASQFLGPIFEAWFTEEVKAKRIDAPGFDAGPISKRAWLNCAWNGDKQPSIDPYKEALADRARIEDGLTTRERAAMELNGSDAMENIKRLKIENKELSEAIFVPGQVQEANQPVDSGQEEDQETDPSEVVEEADFESLKAEFDAYGVGVRAGSLTPQIEDEEYYRKKTGLPELSPNARDAWSKESNVRRPITLTPLPGSEPQTQPTQPQDEQQ